MQIIDVLPIDNNYLFWSTCPYIALIHNVEFHKRIVPVIILYTVTVFLGDRQL